MPKKNNKFIDPFDSPPKKKPQFDYEDYDEDEEFEEYDYEDESDEDDDLVDAGETTSDDVDFGDNIGVGSCMDDGPELGSEEIALNREYIISASAKAFTTAIQTANLSMGCKRAFQQVVDANFNKDVFLAYISNPAVAKLNLKLALSHVSLSCIPHDIYQPEYVQLKTNILEAYPFIISRGIGGRERYYQGLHRSESRSGESMDAFSPEKPESKQKSGWKNILKR